MNELSKKVTFGYLIKFALPTIIMMLFLSLYTMIDGIFIARYVGTMALSGANIVYPILNIVVAIAIMFATGGSAVVATKLGEGKEKEAKENFSLIVLVAFSIGVLILSFGLFFIEPVIKALGATPLNNQYCLDYAKMLLIFTPFGILQMLYQYFFVVAGKPQMGLFFIIMGGITNILLDILFVAVLKMGIKGAGLATGLGFMVPAISGTIYFFFKRKGTIYFVKPKFNASVLFKSCTNGSSEMVTNISAAIITFLFNKTMLRLIGEEGVSAMTIVLYAQFFLVAIFLGYSSGVAPIISYNVGNRNYKQLKKTFKHSLNFIIISSLTVFLLSILLGDKITLIFTSKDNPVYEIAVKGFYLFSLGYLFVGINIFASALFTALGKGVISAILSFLRTFGFLVICILTVPLVLGVDGLWLSIPLAEFLSLFISLAFMINWARKVKFKTIAYPIELENKLENVQKLEEEQIEMKNENIFQ